MYDYDINVNNFDLCMDVQLKYASSSNVKLY